MKFKIISIVAVLIAISSILLISSCENMPKFTNSSTEGKIVFDITYLDSVQLKTMLDLMPEEMNEFYKDNDTKIQMGMGIFSTSYISKFKERTNKILLKIMYEKQAHKENPGDTSLVFSNTSGMIITKSEETKKIAGYKCKKASVTFENDTIEPFDIFYTDKIKITEPNRNNPFKEIDGVLMEFQVTLINIRMRFTAKEHQKIEVLTEEFDIPENYKVVERQIMQETLESLKMLFM